MRKSKTSASDLEKQEQLIDQQRNSVRGGLGLMKVRDRGWARVHELDGNETLFVWGVKDDLAADNKFKLIIKGKTYIYDAEEFRKYLRWA